MTRIKNAGPQKIMQPSEVAERNMIHQVASRSTKNNGGGGSPSKAPEADQGIISQLRGGQKKTFGNGQSMVNHGAAASNNDPIKNKDAEPPKARARDLGGMER